MYENNNFLVVRLKYTCTTNLKISQELKITYDYYS